MPKLQTSGYKKYRTYKLCIGQPHFGNIPVDNYNPWYWKLLYKIPYLFKRCGEGNYHWFFERLCWCLNCEHYILNKWTDTFYE